MKKHDLISSCGLFCFGLFIVLYAPQFDIGSLSSPGSGFMPFLSGLIICGFATVTFFGAFRETSTGAEKIWNGVNFYKLISVLLILCLYALSLKSLGFIICSFCLILLLMRYVGSQPWFNSVLGGAFSSIASYFLFEMCLKAELPKGILGF